MPLTKKDLDIESLIQNMLEGLILQNTEGKIIFYNKAALDILGITQEQLLTLNNSDETNTEWNKIFPHKNHIGMNSFLSGKPEQNVVLKIFTRDGEMRWISLNTVPIRLSSPNDHVLLCTFSDVTEIKKNLNELKQIQLLFNISQDPMIITNLEGYFKKINPKFISLLGYNLNEINSEKFLNLVHEEDLDETQIQIKKLIEKKDTAHFINRYRAKNNNYLIFDWLVVLDVETNLIYFTARDITSYRSEELELLHSSKVYSIGELTSGIAYLLNSQLSIINGHISSIRANTEHGKIDYKELKDKIINIEDSMATMSKTTKDLILFARIIENEKISNVSLNRILDNIIGLCKERFRIHGVKLEIKLENDLFIHARESQIAHIILSILNMAYDDVHTMRDCWVELTGLRHEKKVRIEIAKGSQEPKISSKKNLNALKGIIEENFGTLTIESNSTSSKIIIEFPEFPNQ